jgi:hypothetical protein
MDRKNIFKLSFVGFVAFMGLMTIIDSSSREIDIPLIPDVSINGREMPEVRPGNIDSHTQVRKELKELFPNARFEMTTFSDSRFQEVDYDSFRDITDFAYDFYISSPLLRYKPESYDCDNYSHHLFTFVDWGGGHLFSGQASIFQITVQYDRPWGGIHGGLHSLNLVKTTRGWYVHEPQSREMIKAEHYPNRNTVLVIDGV